MQNGEIEHIWKLLDSVPDPEIPVISIVELGVVREIKKIDNYINILITPTYSGCPAVKTFTDDIKECLKISPYPQINSLLGNFFKKFISLITNLG